MAGDGNELDLDLEALLANLDYIEDEELLRHIAEQLMGKLDPVDEVEGPHIVSLSRAVSRSRLGPSGSP